MKKSNNLAQNIASPILSLTEYIKNIGQEKTNNKNNFDAGIAEVDFIANFSTQIQRVNNEFYATNQKLAQMNQDLEIMVKNEDDKKIRHRKKYKKLPQKKERIKEKNAKNKGKSFTYIDTDGIGSDPDLLLPELFLDLLDDQPEKCLAVL